MISAPNTNHSAIQIHLLSEDLKQYISNLRENLSHFVEKYCDIEDLGLKWDLVKMEIRGLLSNFPRLKQEKDEMKKPDLPPKKN